MKNFFLTLFLLSNFAYPASAADDVSAIQVRNRTRLDSNKNLQVIVAFRKGIDKTTSQVDWTQVKVTIGEKTVTPTALKVQAYPPFSTLIEVDTSGSMQVVFADLKIALKQYVTGLRRGTDYSALGAIADQWTLKHDLTDQSELIHQQIDALKAESKTTALYESMTTGTIWLNDKGDSYPQRRLVLVFSDGLNEKPPTLNEVTEKATSLNMDINVIVFETKKTSDYLNQLSEPKSIAEKTGGIYFQTNKKDAFNLGLAILRDNVMNEFVMVIPSAELPQDGKQHAIKFAYQGKEVSAGFTAPFSAVVEVPMEPEMKAEPAPVPAPAAPAKNKEKTNWLIWILAGAGVLLLGIAFFIMHLNRKKREEEAKQAELARLEAEQATRNKPEPVVLEAKRSPSGVMPAVEEKKPAAAAGPRRTSFEPDAGATITRLVPLTGYEGPAIGLPGGSPVIGADGACDVVLDVRSISGRHAQFMTTSRGLAVRDLGSTNGTFVDGVKIGADPVDLHAGSKLQFGVVVFRCE